MNGHNDDGLMILPIFCDFPLFDDVDPDDGQSQKGDLGKPLEELVEKDFPKEWCQTYRSGKGFVSFIVTSTNGTPLKPLIKYLSNHLIFSLQRESTAMGSQYTCRDPCPQVMTGTIQDR
ncbi:hypothetical protein RJT34_20414 [Clitoria ternatea]|uniref:Uncharacterized protein n=1 Tax=Clitoria ternatea TaxID=43366 RepID=A0AAN9ISV6_CLITE